MEQPVGISDLYKTYRKLILSYFLSERLSLDVAEDLTQDVFLRYRKAEYRFPNTEARRTLLKISKNLFYDHLRHERVKRSSGLSDEQTADVYDSPQIKDETLDLQRTLEARSDFRVVAKGIKSLPPKCRDVFIDFRFHGLSHGELASKYGISKSMVEKHLARATAKLIAHLKRSG